MNDHASLARRGAARFLIGPLAALCLGVPVLADPGPTPQEKAEATKVAKKMERPWRPGKAEDDREALRRFQDAVAEYADLHARQLAKLGTQESTATQRRSPAPWRRTAPKPGRETSSGRRSSPSSGG